MPLSFKQLCEHFDVKQPSALARLLKARGVSYMLDRKGRPTTTEDALDRALRVAKRKIIFSKPPCKKKDRFRQASGKNTAHGTTSIGTSGQSYVE